jgi:hypothetical protein
MLGISHKGRLLVADEVSIHWTELVEFLGGIKNRSDKTKKLRTWTQTSNGQVVTFSVRLHFYNEMGSQDGIVSLRQFVPRSLSSNTY